MLKFKQYIVEGGNAVKDVTSIHQENVKATMEKIYSKLLPKLGITSKETALLGSTGKKNPGGQSGDVDLAVSAKDIMIAKNISDPKKVYDKIYSACRKVSHDVNDMRNIGIVSCAFPIVNVDGKQENMFVQLDLMLTDNLEFSKWMYHSPAEWESEWKGLYRNSALSAISHYAGKEAKDDDVNYSRLLLNYSSGLHKVLMSKQGKAKILKRAKEVERKLVGKDAQTIIDYLLGPSFKYKEILTWQDIFKAMNSPKFIHKAHKAEIFKRIVADVEHKGYPAPKELN